MQPQEITRQLGITGVHDFGSYIERYAVDERSRNMILDERRETSLENQAGVFDGSQLKRSQKIVPIVDRKLKHVRSAIELGAGTGFRLLCYAAANPETTFLGIERLPSAKGIIEERARILGLKNVRAITADFMYDDLDVKAEAVIGIDLFTGRDFEEFKQRNSVDIDDTYLSRVIRMLDTSGRYYFTCGQFESLNDAAAAAYFAEKKGLNYAEAVGFKYTQRGVGARKELVVFLSSSKETMPDKIKPPLFQELE